MKILLFILALTLCASYPSFKDENLDFLDDPDFPFETPDDLDSIDIPLEDDKDHVPRWLFSELFPSEETSLEEIEDRINEEEILILNEEGLLAGDNYAYLPRSEIERNARVLGVLAYGLNQVIAKGNQQGKIPAGDYDITRIISVARRETRNTESYRFRVEAEDDDNNVGVKAQFNVDVDKATQEMKLNGYSYKASNVKFTIDESAFTPVDEAEWNSPQIQDCLDAAIEAGVKQSDQYPNVDVNNVWTQTRRGTVYYKYDVTLNNGGNTTVNLEAIVSYKPESGAIDVKSYSTRTTRRN